MRQESGEGVRQESGEGVREEKVVREGKRRRQLSHIPSHSWETYLSQSGASASKHSERSPYPSPLLSVLTVLFPPPLDHLLKFHSTWWSDT